MQKFTQKVDISAEKRYNIYVGNFAIYLKLRRNHYDELTRKKREADFRHCSVSR